MKIKSFLLLLAVSLAMVACIDNTGTHTTPQMMLGNLYVNPQFEGDSLIGAKDTLGDYYDTTLDLIYLDTLQLGDTVMFPALFSSDMNNLVSVYSTYDTTRVNMWFQIDMENDAVRKALTADSKPEKSKLFFNPMYNIVTFPIYIVPQEAGSYPIVLTVVSDSNFPTYSVAFTLPVK